MAEPVRPLLCPDCLGGARLAPATGKELAHQDPATGAECDGPFAFHWPRYVVEGSVCGSGVGAIWFTCSRCGWNATGTLSWFG